MKKAVEERVKLPEKEAPKSMLETLIYKNLYRAKGRKGVYEIAKINAGNATIRPFLSNLLLYAKTEDLICLDDYVFYIKEVKGVGCSIGALFLNIEKNQAAIEKETSGTNVMEMILPGYDPELFLERHAKEVVEYYYFILGAYSQFKKETERK